MLPTIGEHRTVRPHRSTYRPPQCDDAATTTPADTCSTRHGAIAAAARRSPPRRRCGCSSRTSEASGPRRSRTIRRPSPSQAAAREPRGGLVSESPALVAMLPTVAQEYPQNDDAVLAPGGGGRRVRYQEGVHDEGTRRDGQSAFRRASADASVVGPARGRVCARRADGRLERRRACGRDIERATLRSSVVAVKRLEVLAEKDEAYWSDDKAAGGTGLVAAVGGSAASISGSTKSGRAPCTRSIGCDSPTTARFHGPIRERPGDTSDAVRKSSAGPVHAIEQASLAEEDERAVNLISTQVDGGIWRWTGRLGCRRGRAGGHPGTEVGDAVGATLYDAYKILQIRPRRSTSCASYPLRRGVPCGHRCCRPANDVAGAFGTRPTESRPSARGNCCARGVCGRGGSRRPQCVFDRQW